MSQLQKLLRLKKPPRRIEGYDISHQSGTDVVASMVVFINGVSDRAEYRKFKLKSQKNDDPSSMREVIERRLKHEEWDYPDLIILDGSTAQISAVHELLRLKRIPVIGRDKSGDHSKNACVNLIVPEENNGLTFKNYSLSPEDHISRLIARVDEEAHRFAITYHRLLKRKNMLK